MKFVLKYLKPYTKKIILLIGLFFIATMADLALPAVMSSIVNDGINAGDMGYIIKMSIVMLIIAVIGLITLIAAIKVNSDVTCRFSADIRASVFSKVCSLSYSEFSGMGTGSLLTRSTEDIGHIQMVADMLIRSVIVVPMLLIGGVILSLNIDVMLSLIMFAFAPIFIIIVMIIGKKIVPLWENSEKYIDKQNKIVRERMSGIRVIRAFNKEDEEHEKLAEATRVMANNIIKANVRANLINPVSLFVLDLVIVLICYTGLIRINISYSSILSGDLIAIIQYVGLIMNALIIFSFALVFLPRINVNIKRLSELLNIEKAPAVIDKTELPFNGNIDFSDVTFQYQGAALPAVDKLNIHINAGQCATIIGGTGSGKSTIVQLLMGFYYPTGGTLTYDGIPVNEISTMKLRNNVACVLQKSMMFAGTIADNIRMGKAEATDEEIKSAAEIAEISKFIEGQNEKYNYVVKEAGANLSGGQKQRLSIARAIVKNSPIFIFDDSFSALDFMTESKVRRNFKNKLKGRTQIIITQRIASAMNSDVIYVLDKGCIIDCGTHKELLKKCTVYREIYNSQIGGGYEKE